MNDILLLVMTNGRRDCISKTIPSALTMLQPGFVHRVICDDSGDEEYHDYLERMFPTFEVWQTNGKEGFGGAIRFAWNRLRQNEGFNYVLHLEDDFIFNEPILLNDMVTVLDRNIHLQQLALLRQPWNAEEKAAGGIIQANPDDFAEHRYGPLYWTQHRRFFTTNPCLYRRSLIEKYDWPEGSNSEGMFTFELRTNYNNTFGIWGKKSDPPKVEHIGYERTGIGY